MDFLPPRTVYQAFAEGPGVEFLCQGHVIEHGIAYSISFLQEIILDTGNNYKVRQDFYCDKRELRDCGAQRKHLTQLGHWGRLPSSKRGHCCCGGEESL